MQMSAKQSRIEKLKLEVRKLEAERDGFKQVTEDTDKLVKEVGSRMVALLSFRDGTKVKVVADCPSSPTVRFA